MQEADEVDEADSEDQPASAEGRTHALAVSEPLIPSHGGYRKLKSFLVAQLVYDVTVRFCDRYVGRTGRMRDQMVHAARSGVQNIAEGSMASGTSKKTELKLTNVARASLEELRLDYEDFLRQRRLPCWQRNDPRRVDLVACRFTAVEEVAAWVQQVYVAGRGARSAASSKSAASTRPEIAANAALALIAVATALLAASLPRRRPPSRRKADSQNGCTESGRPGGTADEPASKVSGLPLVESRDVGIMVWPGQFPFSRAPHLTPVRTGLE